MRAVWVMIPILGVLTACGDPLGGIERVSELPEPLPASPSAAALPSVEEDKTPILAGLFRRSEPASKTDPAIVAALTEAQGLPPVDSAPSQPANDTAASAVEADTDAAALTASALAATDAQVFAPKAERRGILGWLRPDASPERQDNAEPEAPIDATAVAQTGDTPDATDAPQDLASATPAAPESDAETSEPVVVASLEPTPDVATDSPRRGLFGLRLGRTGTDAAASAAAKPRTGPDARDVTLGTALPFGEIARVCGAKPRDMGTLIERAARKGSGYALYDSAPGSPGPRTFYVTGFSDKCPRQFTAAIALFGEPVLHEQLRYGLPARDFPYSETDEAYEKVKARVCNVSRSKPCGSKVSRLENTTTFVSVYENFGENARWSDMLLHDGEVLAAALKNP